MNISEFSHKIGVSKTTVSNVITGNGRISEATREMVFQKMRELGFTPNRNAQRLSLGRSYMVGLSVVAGEAAGFDLFNLTISQELARALHKRNYDLLFCPVADSVEGHRILLDKFKSRVADGMIFQAAYSMISDIVPKIARQDHPCVVMDVFPVEGIKHVASIVHGTESGIRDAFEMLTNYGHSRIAYISNGFDHIDTVPTVFRQKLTDYGITLPDVYSVGDGPTVENGARAFQQLMSLPNRPTAILTRNDMLAFGAMSQARTMGLRIPDDISLISMGYSPSVSVTDPPLTGIHADCSELTEAAVKVLFEMLEDPDKDIAPQVIDSKLVLMGSVGRVKSGGK